MLESRVNDRGVTTLLRRLTARSTNLSPVMRQIAGIMHDAVEQNFEAEGPGWQRLAGSTIRGRAKRGHWPGKILQESGQLVSSISSRSDAKSARVGTNKVQAAILHSGGDVKRWPHSSWVRLRTDASGNLLRQGGNKNLAIFAKGSHKRAVTRRYTSQGWTVHIPARPYMRLSGGALERIKAALLGWVVKG